MTGSLLLDWAILAVSLFNTILLLWLGLTVLLNAEHRTWGVWLAGGGLLSGGAFFLSHSAILGHNPALVSRGADLWWRIGWGPVIASPFAWYILMLWYAGFWDSKRTHLRRRQRIWFVVVVLFAIMLIGLILFANALPSYAQVVKLGLVGSVSMGGFAALILIYPPFVILCITLSLDTVYIYVNGYNRGYVLNQIIAESIWTIKFTSEKPSETENKQRNNGRSQTR